MEELIENADINYALIYGWVAFLIAEGVGIHCVNKLKKISMKLYDDGRVPNDFALQHSVPSFITMVIVIAHGICMFRLLPGVNTRLLKHIHAVVHLLAGWISWRTALYMRKVKGSSFERPYPDVSIPSTHHMNFGPDVYKVYVVQVIAAIFVFYYMYPNQYRRRTFAQFHNYLGIVSFTGNVACSAVVMHSNSITRGYRDKQNFSILKSMFVYLLLIYSIVLNPFLEWKVVRSI